VRIAGGGGTGPARAPALAVGPDNSVYLAWTVGEEAGADIRLARSSDGGRTFGAPAVVARTGGYSDAPKLAVDQEGTVHVVHGESSGGPFGLSHVRYTRSHDGGRTFEPGREISSPQRTGSESAAFPALGLDDQGIVYVLWEIYPDRHEPPRGLAVAYSRDGGQTFSTPAIVPGSSDPAGGSNGSRQGLLMRKLAVNRAGAIAVVNSSFRHNEKSRAWLTRGQLRP
jgi:hypothetical protein